ncbi:MAG: hypothetical protein QOE90_1441 [Thermoplasmata archaeon]|jgi:hypothetical protein|nr:hypothetical protein [Thermoplasmata archaeon]
MRSIPLLVVALGMLLAAPLAGALPIPPPVSVCTAATSSTCGHFACVRVEASTHCTDFVISKVGVCTENHPPCAWDELACVYSGSNKIVCVPDIS